MDWNQISNYAARHTHKKLGLGEARASGWSARDSRGRGVQTPVQSARPGPLAGSELLVCAPGRRAAPLRGGGSFQFCVWDRGCALAPWGSLRRAAVATAPEGLSDPAAPPLRLPCSRRRAARTDGAPAHSARAHRLGRRCRRSATGLAHGAGGFARRGRAGLDGPLGVGHTPTSSWAHTQNHAHTHTDSCLDTPPAVSPSTAPFPVPAAPRPTLRPFLSCRAGREGRRTGARLGEAWPGLLGPGAARKKTRFPSLVPGAPNKRAARPPPARRAWFPPPEPRLETRAQAEKKRPEQRNKHTEGQRETERKGDRESRKEKKREGTQKKTRSRRERGCLVEVPAPLKLSLQPHLPARCRRTSPGKAAEQQKTQIYFCTLLPFYSQPSC